MNKTMETGELKLYLRVIKVISYIRTYNWPSDSVYKSKPKSACIYWTCLAAEKHNSSHNPPSQLQLAYLRHRTC